MENLTRIFIADDHQIVIDGLSLLLKNENNILIIGTATNGIEAFNAIQNLKPDIALLDIRMPDKDGLQIVQSLSSKIKTKFIILSMHNERRFINDAINYGAKAFLLKNTGKQDLLNTIELVNNGKKKFPENIEKSEKSNSILTQRELDILRLIIGENTSIEISEKLNLSQFTVETHRRNIFKKTGAKNMIGLLKFAIDNNINFS